MPELLNAGIKVELYKATGLNFDVEHVQTTVGTMVRVCLQNTDQPILEIPLDQLSTEADILKYLPRHLHAENLLLAERLRIARRLFQEDLVDLMPFCAAAPELVEVLERRQQILPSVADRVGDVTGDSNVIMATLVREARMQRVDAIFSVSDLAVRRLGECLAMTRGAS